MPEIPIDTRIDENGLLSLRMPPALAGLEIEGTLAYRVQSARLPEREKKTKINLDTVRDICREIRNLPVLDSRTPEEIIEDNE